MKKFINKYYLFLAILIVSFQTYPGPREDFQKFILGALNRAVQEGVAICHLECDKERCTNGSYPGVVFHKGDHFLDINSPKSSPCKQGEYAIDPSDASESPAARETTCVRLAKDWNAKYLPIVKMCERAARVCKYKRNYDTQKESSLKHNCISCNAMLYPACSMENYFRISVNQNLERCPTSDQL